MGLIASAKGGGDFIPAPQGVHQGVCVDVVDMGMVDGGWGPKHTCRIVFQLATQMPDGKRFIVNRKFTVSLHEKGNLLPFLQNWRGQAFSASELEKFDLDTLIGANGNVQVMHNESKGQTYANITAVLPLMQGQPKIQNDGYIRVQDRDKPSPQQTAQRSAPQQPPKPHPSQWQSSNQGYNDDSDIPF